MKVKVVGVESRIGQAKNTGNDYAIFSMRCVAEIPQGRQTKVNPNNVHVKAGYAFMESDISKELFDKIESQGGYPFDADVNVEQEIGRNNNMINVITDVTPQSSISSSAEKLTGRKTAAAG